MEQTAQASPGVSITEHPKTDRSGFSSMEIIGFKKIHLETLNSLKELNRIGDRVVFKNITCYFCKKHLDITVVKTESGYGFLNGYLSEPVGGQMLTVCVGCVCRQNLKSTG